MLLSRKIEGCVFCLPQINVWDQSTRNVLKHKGGVEMAFNSIELLFLVGFGCFVKIGIKNRTHGESDVPFTEPKMCP